MVNEEDADGDMLVPMKAAPQANRQREGNGLELPKPLVCCLGATSTQSNSTWRLVAGPGNQL